MGFYIKSREGHTQRFFLLNKTFPGKVLFNKKKYLRVAFNKKSMWHFQPSPYVLLRTYHDMFILN